MSSLLLFSCGETNNNRILEKGVNLIKVYNYIDKNDYTRAKFILDSILSYTESVEARYLRAFIYYERYQVDSCNSDLSQVLKVYPNDTQANYLYANNCLFSEKNFGKALKIYGNVELEFKEDRNRYFYHNTWIKIDSLNLYTNIGFCLQGLKDYKKALIIVNSLIEKYPHEAMLFNDRANNKLALNDTLGACDDYAIFKKSGETFRNLEIEKICSRAGADIRLRH
jgi:tetratricopeptide (TPR) repeat protein